MSILRINVPFSIHFGGHLGKCVISIATLAAGLKRVNRNYLNHKCTKFGNMKKNELTNDIHFGRHFGSCTFDKTHIQSIDKRNAIKNLEENRWQMPYLFDHTAKEMQPDKHIDRYLYTCSYNRIFQI